MSEGVTEDITQESSTKSETDALDRIVDPSPAQPSMQASPEKIVEEPDTSSLLKEVSQETAEIVVEELCAGALLVEATQETIEKVMEEQGSLLKEALQETTPPRVPADSAVVQSCSIGQRKDDDDESPCSKDSAIFAASTEQLPSNVTDIIDLLIAVDVEQPKSLDIKDKKHAKELTTASQVLTISPVPIQVAESVLQVEPKESVSDSQAVTEQVLSSTITPVHESAAVPCSLIDAGNKIQVNGSASGVVSAESEGKSSRAATEAVESIDDAATKLSESSTPSTETLQVLPPTEEPLVTSALPSSITKSTLEARVDKTLQQTTESDQQTKETASCAKETRKTKESPPPSECAVTTEASPSSESPVRPSRAKELNVPSTSAPETPTQESKDQEKVTKKVARKSIDKSASEGEPGETTEADVTGKKVVKKVVKKVTKKPKSKPEEALDDGAQDNSSSSSANKPKKTVKVTKKGNKSLQTPDTPDTAAVSETPSSSTSDTPVPPKRKSKAPPTKPAVKKPDVE